MSTTLKGSDVLADGLPSIVVISGKTNFESAKIVKTKLDLILKKGVLGSNPVKFHGIYF